MLRASFSSRYKSTNTTFMDCIMLIVTNQKPPTCRFKQPRISKGTRSLHERLSLPEPTDNIHMHRGKPMSFQNQTGISRSPALMTVAFTSAIDKPVLKCFIILTVVTDELICLRTSLKYSCNYSIFFLPVSFNIAKYSPKHMDISGLRLRTVAERRGPQQQSH